MSEKNAKEARRAEALKGWKIDVRGYTSDQPVFTPDNKPLIRDGKQVVTQDNIDVREDLAAMLFHTELRQGPDEMFKAKDLADKIRASEEFVLLDKQEMERIKRSYALLKGLPERFIEFLSRIRDAEEVSLKEDAPA